MPARDAFACSPRAVYLRAAKGEQSLENGSGRDWNDPHSGGRNSIAWTSLSSDADDPFTDDRGDLDQLNVSPHTFCQQEYNQLADKHGMRSLFFDNNDESQQLRSTGTHGGDRRSWFARAFSKPPSGAASSRRSSRHSIGSRSDMTPKHKRSDSDPPVVGHGSKKDSTDRFKNESLETLIRICGKSLLYLPSEYATRSLVLPTCFRAAAQYLVQNGMCPATRGIFRISGSMRVVNELYDYYCVDLEDGTDIATTVRSPNLPFHIKAGVHDVASMFKRLLAGLPGGVLGSVALFEALVEVRKAFGQGHSSSSGLDSTLQNHSMARLLALAIGAVPSQYQRELICAVFGLLNLIGHMTERAPSQNTDGGYPPNAERMGYGALGIIFGPLLLGERLEAYIINGPHISPGLLSSSASATTPALPANPSPRLRSDRRPKSMVAEKPTSALPATLDKILLANDVAEMMITHWRGIVCQMKHVGVMRKESLLRQPPQGMQEQDRVVRPETFADNNDRSLPPQTPVFYGPRLRKARSASVNRKSDSILFAKQPPSGQISQRPADMTFEEFAARKKLKNRASSISIASDSTTFVPSDVHIGTVMLPPTEPLATILTVAKANVSHADGPNSKQTKQRRTSSGMSTLLGDKSESCDKEVPTIKKPYVLHRSENRAIPAQNSATVSPSPWKISLKPVKASNADIRQVGGSVASTGSPKKDPGRRVYHRRQAIQSSQHIEELNVPQSKTAALISRIMNSRHQAASSSPKKPDVCNSPPLAEEMSLESRGLRERVLPESGATKLVLDSGDHGIRMQSSFSPTTPRQHLGARSTQLSTTTNGHTPNTKESGDMSGPKACKSPLSEIKNDARSLTRSRSKTMAVSTTPGNRGTGTQKTRCYHSESGFTTVSVDMKATATGSSVKAMAAMFDNAIWKETPGTTPIGHGQRQSQSRNTPKTNKDVLPQYSSNITPLKAAPMPHRSTPIGEQRLVDSNQASERRHLRLTRSEDRNSRADKISRLVASERRDLTRSVDRRYVANTDIDRNARADKCCTDLGGTFACGPRQMHDLQRCLKAKTAECQTWKERAEKAEREVLRLTTLMADADKDREKLQSVVSFMRGESDTDDGTLSDKSMTTVVVRGRLGNERLLPFL